MEAPNERTQEKESRRKNRKGSSRRSPDKKQPDEEDNQVEDNTADEDYVVEVISSCSPSEDDQSDCEEVLNEEQGVKKYQRRPRFLSPDDFEQAPLLRVFATGPSPLVKDKENPQAYFYCRICRRDISTDKSYSRTPRSLALNHFKADKHYNKDVKYRILRGLPAYHRDGTLMMQEEVNHKRRTFDNSPPVVVDHHLYYLVGQDTNKNLVDICAEGPERQTISQINLIHSALKEGIPIAGVEEVLKRCLARVTGSIAYDWSSPNLYVSIQVLFSLSVK